MDEPTRRIFISYRREDTPHVAGRLFDQLKPRFGDRNVFNDVDSIGLGLDFAEAIEQAVGSCDVLLALIGPRWVDEHGLRRLKDPDDFVALEIATALDRGIRVIQILVDGAAMPRHEKLPKALATLPRRQALRLDYATFRAAVTALEQALPAPMPTAGRSPSPTPGGAGGSSPPGAPTRGAHDPVPDVPNRNEADDDTEGDYIPDVPYLVIPHDLDNLLRELGAVHELAHAEPEPRPRNLSSTSISPVVGYPPAEERLGSAGPPIRSMW